MSGGGGSSGNTTTSTSAPPPAVQQAYTQVMGQATNVAGQPLNQYSGPIVAGFTPSQMAGFGTINASQGMAQPYINQAASYMGTAAQPINPGTFDTSSIPDQWASNVTNAGQQAGNYANTFGGNAHDLAQQAAAPLNMQGYDTLSQFTNPYTQQVTDATRGLFNEQNAQQQQQVQGNATSRGAYGGDREAVAQALTAQQENIAQAPVLANIQQQGFQQAQQELNQQQALELQQGTSQGQLRLGAANANIAAGQLGLGATQQQAALAQQQIAEYNAQQQASIGAQQATGWLQQGAGYGLASLGNEAQNSAITGANAEINAGAQQQQQQQALLNVPFEQFTQQQAYPFQTTGWLGNLATGVGSNLGGTSSTTTPGPSTIGQIAGLGTAGVGLFGAAKDSGLFGSSADAAASAANNGWGSFGNRGGRVGYADGGEVPSSIGDIPDLSVSVIPPGQPGGSKSGAMSPLAPVQTTQSSGGGGGSGALGAIGTAVGIASKVLPFFLKDGGNVPGYGLGGVAPVTHAAAPIVSDLTHVPAPSAAGPLTQAQIQSVMNFAPTYDAQGFPVGMKGVAPGTPAGAPNTLPIVNGVLQRGVAPAGPAAVAGPTVDPGLAAPVVDPSSQVFVDNGGGGARGGRADHFDDGGAVSLIPDVSKSYITSTGQLVKGPGVPQAPKPGVAQDPLKDLNGGIGSLDKLFKKDDKSTSSADATAGSGWSSGNNTNNLSLGGMVDPIFAYRGYDLGGTVQQAGQISSGGASPLQSGQVSQYMQLPIEQLQEMAMRAPPGTPQGAAIMHALQIKKMSPGAATGQSAPGASGSTSAPTAFSSPTSALAPGLGGYARGGRQHFDDGGLVEQGMEDYRPSQEGQVIPIKPREGGAPTLGDVMKDTGGHDQGARKGDVLGAPDWSTPEEAPLPAGASRPGWKVLLDPKTYQDETKPYNSYDDVKPTVSEPSSFVPRVTAAETAGVGSQPPLVQSRDLQSTDAADRGFGIEREPIKASATGETAGMGAPVSEEAAPPAAPAPEPQYTAPGRRADGSFTDDNAGARARAAAGSASVAPTAGMGSPSAAPVPAAAALPPAKNWIAVGDSLGGQMIDAGAARGSHMGEVKAKGDNPWFDTADGRSIAGTLASVKFNLARDPNYYKGQYVRLSPGTSNSPGQIDQIQPIVDLLKGPGGAAGIQLVGVGTRAGTEPGSAYFDGNKYNPTLEALATKNNLGWTGGIPNTVVHPARSYWNGVPATAPTSVAQSAAEDQTAGVGAAAPKLESWDEHKNFIKGAADGSIAGVGGTPAATGEKTAGFGPVATALQAEATRQNVPWSLVSRAAQIESGMGTNVGTRGNVLQLGHDEWLQAGGGDMRDLGTQARNGVAWLAKSQAEAAQALGRPPQDFETYVVHQQGAAGGPALLKAPPGQSAIDALAPAYNGNRARAETAIIGNGGSLGMTAQQFVEMTKARFEGFGSRLNLGANLASGSGEPASGVGGDPVISSNGTPGLGNGSGSFTADGRQVRVGSDPNTGQPRLEARKPGFGASPWLPVIAAGFGMMASRSPHALTAIGEGGLAGVKAAEGQEAQNVKTQVAELRTQHLADLTGVRMQAVQQQANNLLERAREFQIKSADANLNQEQRNQNAQMALILRGQAQDALNQYHGALVENANQKTLNEKARIQQQMDMGFKSEPAVDAQGNPGTQRYRFDSTTSRWVPDGPVVSGGHGTLTRAEELREIDLIKKGDLTGTMTEADAVAALRARQAALQAPPPPKPPDQATATSGAKAAIAAGKPRDAIIQQMRAWGYDPAGL